MFRLSVRFLLPLIGLVWRTSFASGEETRTLRILAVGDLPPFRQEIRDGIRYEIPPPEGSEPPTRIEISAADDEGEEQKKEYEITDTENPGMVLQLNHLSRRVTMPVAELDVSLLAKGVPWHTCKLPEGGDYLLVLWRDPKVKKWSKARSILLPDGGSAFKSGDALFINVSPVNLGFQLGDDAFRLVPGKAITKPLGVVPAGIATKAFYQDSKGASKRIWSSALVQNKGERSVVVVYFADGMKPRRPLKLVAFRERAASLPR